MTNPPKSILAPHDPENGLINGASFFRGTRPQKNNIALKNFPKLNASVGGGFYFGESTMIAGIASGGKTALAMQMADDFATSGNNVLVVTTKHRPRELFLRGVSNRLKVELDQLIAGEAVNLDAGTCVGNIPDPVKQKPELENAYSEMSSVYEKHLHFLVWPKGASINKRFDIEIDKIEQTGWTPVVILFDQISGGLGAVPHEGDELRHYYQAAANHLISYGKQKQRIMIMTAELNSSQIPPDCAMVEMGMLAKCKGMADNLTNLIGITALCSRMSRFSEPPQLKLGQKLCLVKAIRGTTGTAIPGEMRLNYQRFVEQP